MALALVLLTAADPPSVVAIRVGTLEGRVALTILTVGAPGAASVRREGDEVVLSIVGQASAGFAAPAAAEPIEKITVGRTSDGVDVRMRVAREVPYELQRDGTLIRVLFGEALPADLAPKPAFSEAAPSPASSDIAALYKSILPPAVEGEAGGQVVGGTTAAGAQAQDEERDGLGLGPVTLRPSLSASYVDATATVAGPQPVHDTYTQVQPRVGAELPVGNGRLYATYEARLRRGSAFSIVGETSHVLDAGFELPFGPSLALRGSEHYVRGALEANEVDPGGEYFFNLAPFTRNEIGASARLRTGGRFDLEVGGSLNRVRFQEPSGFFDYDQQIMDTSLGMEVGANLRVALTYRHRHVPPTDRLEADSTANSAGLSLKGEILPLVTGAIALGYEDRTSPKAAAGGTEYQGLAASIEIAKEFARASRLALSGARATRLSAFEKNGFYVSSSVGAQLTFLLPLSLAGQAGAGYNWNDYRTNATALGMPRRDQVFSWSAGAGRSIGRWAYLRADYTLSRRTSNLDAFRTRTHSFTVQIAAGFFGTKERTQ
jgi:hypothetical protein